LMGWWFKRSASGFGVSRREPVGRPERDAEGVLLGPGPGIPVDLAGFAGGRRAVRRSVWSSGRVP